MGELMHCVASEACVRGAESLVPSQAAAAAALAQGLIASIWPRPPAVCKRMRAVGCVACCHTSGRPPAPSQLPLQNRLPHSQRFAAVTSHATSHASDHTHAQLNQRSAPALPPVSATMMLKATSSSLRFAAAPARAGKRVAVCKAAETETPAAPAPSTAASTSDLPIPEGLPDAGVDLLKFLNSTNFKLQDTDLYKNTLKQYLENKYVVDATGFKALPETINGRAAMLGFVAGASAEILGAGPLLLQLSKFPQPVLAAMLLITAGSIIPIVKGTEGDYLKSLRETYTVPEGVFTEPLERVHGRLAMLGIGALIVLELLKGSAVL